MEPSTWEQFKALLKKDIITFARSGPELAAMLLFLAVISLVAGYSSNLFAYTVDEKALSVASATASMIVFMAVFVTGRGFSREAELGILDILRAQPLDLTIVFAARTVFNAILLVTVSLLGTMVLAFFGNIPLYLFVQILVLSIGFALYLAPIVGVSSAIAVHTGGILIPSVAVAVLSAPAMQLYISGIVLGSMKPLWISIAGSLGLSLLVLALIEELLG
ncbi:MAG: hypothetical protein GSR77_07140 [Desulfurococcales archaeon]|nr:hypothetical protein [Desulfurococcales archaeon]